VGSAERVTLATDAGPIAALQAGRADAPPVLLVPGFTGSKEDFGPLLDPIAGGGFRVTAIDLPGQYQSPGPHDPAAYTPDRLAATVLALSAGLDPRGDGVRLLGHSYGGLVARAAVIDRPAAFTSLVLMGSGPGVIGDERRAVLEALAPVLAEVGVAGVYAASLQLDAAQPGYVEPPAELAAFLRERFLAGSPAMLQGMADALRSEPDRVDELAATGIRTLVLHGVDDVPWPVAQQHAMAQRLGAGYVVIPGAAHSPAVENPPLTASALLSFWRG